MSSIFFNQLPIPQQAALIFREGRFLDTRYEPEFIVDIYQIRGLYAEVYFNQVNEDFIVIRSFYSDENPTVEEPEKAVFHKLPPPATKPAYFSC